MNIKEDISNVFEIIKWEYVDESLIIELIIKYSHIISGNKKLENMFISAFEKKYNNSSAVGNILKSLFSAGLKIDYIKLFTEMKKSQKNNKIYKYFNSQPKFKNNIYEYNNENSSLSKDSSSFKEGIQQILNESIKKENKKIKNFTFNNSINDIEEENLKKNNDIKIKKQNKEKNDKTKNNNVKTNYKNCEEKESTLVKLKKIEKTSNKNNKNTLSKNLSFLNKGQLSQTNKINNKKLKIKKLIILILKI
jgi:hypothetical protein